jgi:hypothetical protein
MRCCPVLHTVWGHLTNPSQVLPLANVKAPIVGAVEMQLRLQTHWPNVRQAAVGGLREGNVQNELERPPVRSSQPLFFSLLVFLLPLPADIKFLLLAPEYRRAFPLELVPVNRQRVLDGDLVTHQFPHG